MSKYTSYPASFGVCELIFNQILLQLIVIAAEKGYVLFLMAINVFKGVEVRACQGHLH
jgi:hypothetical protein